jgi:DNA (cytosine-5)-methyltransferase 1
MSYICPLLAATSALHSKSDVQAITVLVLTFHSTREGPNDQANMEALFTVGPVLNKVRPRVATLEQTFGLLTFGQHKANFNMLLHDIGKAGYDIRYKLQNLSEFGLVQPRKRLLIIAARQGHSLNTRQQILTHSRRGIPLPPFPKPTHGPAGSGLKPYRLIHDALLPIQRLGFRATNDKYHQTKLAAEPRAPTSPHKFLKGCITTGGAEEYHYSGLRKYTPRELALFQSFPYAYSFTGSNTEAMKQIGNAFPPTMAEALYRTISKTLEAFDNNLIGVEDDLSDLDALLERKGVRLPRAPAVTSSYLA